MDHTEQRLFGLTSIIEAFDEHATSQGSGFFFCRFGDDRPDEKAEKSGWRPLGPMHFVTNRHVVTTDDAMMQLASKLRILIRVNRGGQIGFEDFKLEGETLRQRVYTAENPSHDIVAIEVESDFKNLLDEIGSEKNVTPIFNVLTPADLPKPQGTPIGLADDVLVVGYPRGFYDTHNLYPVAKAGIIGSPWGMHYEGAPCFLIDAKLFPGSSGSVVISKPTGFIFDHGQLKVSKEGNKRFALLGVFSGEPFRRGEKIQFDDFTIERQYKFNLGIVWYADLIQKIIADRRLLAAAEG